MNHGLVGQINQIKKFAAVFLIASFVFTPVLPAFAVSSIPVALPIEEKRQSEPEQVQSDESSSVYESSKEEIVPDSLFVVQDAITDEAKLLDGRIV